MRWSVLSRLLVLALLVPVMHLYAQDDEDRFYQESRETVEFDKSKFLADDAQDPDLEERFKSMIKDGALKDKKILMVEDDYDIRETVAIYYDRKEIDVTLASNIKEAEDQIENKRFDLVYLDLNMEQTSGSSHKLIKLIRAKGLNVPVIAFSGVALARSQKDEFIKNLWDEGFNGCLFKPIGIGFITNSMITYLGTKNKFYNTAPAEEQRIQEQPVGYNENIFHATEIEKLCTTEQIQKYDDMLDAGVLKDKNIMLVEDDKVTTMVLSILLRNKGANVFTADNIDEVQQNIANNKFDLIYLDLNIDQTSETSTEMLKLIRTNDTKVPIVAITAFGDISREQDQLFWDSGFSGYISKFANMKYASIIFLNAKNKFYNSEHPVEQAVVYDEDTFFVKRIRYLKPYLDKVPEFEESIKNGVLENKKILLFDDEETTLLRQISTLLKCRDKAKPTITSNVEEFKELIRKEKFDIIYLDLNMRQTSETSHELIKFVRSIDTKVPVIAYTGFGPESAKGEDLWDMGFSGYLYKMLNTEYASVIFLNAKNKFYNTAPVTEHKIQEQPVEYDEHLFYADNIVDPAKTAELVLTLKNNKVLKGKKVLLFDDDMDREIAAELWLGCGTELPTIEENLEIAKRLIETEKFDIIYIDLNINQTSEQSMKLLQFIRSRDVKTPVVACSGDYPIKTQGPELWKQGFSGYYYKWYNIGPATLTFLDAKNIFYNSKPGELTGGEPNIQEDIEPKPKMDQAVLQKYDEIINKYKNAPDTEKNYFINNRTDKPKEAVSLYVEPEGIDVPELYYSLKTALDSGEEFIIRSENPEELDGGSGVANSYRVTRYKETPIETTLKDIYDAVNSNPNEIKNYSDWIIKAAISDYLKTSTVDQQILETLLYKKELVQPNSLLKNYLAISVITPEEYLKKASFSYSKYIKGKNGMVIANNAVPDMYYVSIQVPEINPLTPGEGKTIVVGNGKILGELSKDGIRNISPGHQKHLPDDSVILGIVKFYQAVTSLPRLRSDYVPLIEFQLVNDQKIYFLQYHLTAKKEQAGFELGPQDILPTKFRAKYVRGVTPPEGIVVTAYLKPSSEMIANPDGNPLGLIHTEDLLDVKTTAAYEYISRKVSVLFMAPVKLDQVASGHRGRTPFIKPKVSVVLTDEQMREIKAAADKYGKVQIKVTSDGDDAVVKLINPPAVLQGKYTGMSAVKLIDNIPELIDGGELKAMLTNKETRTLGIVTAYGLDKVLTNDNRKEYLNKLEKIVSETKTDISYKSINEKVEAAKNTLQKLTKEGKLDLDLFRGKDGDIYILALEKITGQDASQIPGAYVLAGALSADGKNLSGLTLSIKIDNVNYEFARNKEIKDYDPEKIKRESMERGRKLIESRPDIK